MRFCVVLVGGTAPEDVREFLMEMITAVGDHTITYRDDLLGVYPFVKNELLGHRPLDAVLFFIAGLDHTHVLGLQILALETDPVTKNVPIIDIYGQRVYENKNVADQSKTPPIGPTPLLDFIRRRTTEKLPS